MQYPKIAATAVSIGVAAIALRHFRNNELHKFYQLCRNNYLFRRKPLGEKLIEQRTLRKRR